ncbi:hypothetical protein [Chitinimonas sp. JJ19]|uniref:hypothetical protein n=1 Tax=Chitinimonas sp. JJ19 TaxID=3109352 RepID=UPI0030031D2A
MVAKDKFELLSSIEFDDLYRLQVGRNRCAHPSINIDDEAYSPSAELAGLNLHSAITHLLQHPLVQGKYALERIVENIESKYFPVAQEKARLALESGPLGRARKVLVRNLLIVLVKELLSKARSMEFKRRMRLSAALLATIELYPEFSREFFEKEFPVLFKAVLDDSMSNAVSFLETYGDSWQYLTNDARKKIQCYASDLPGSALDDDLGFLLEFPMLKEYAQLSV